MRGLIGLAAVVAFLIGGLLVITWNNEGVSVAEAVQAACGTLSSTDYDVTTTIATDIGSTTITSEYSSDDNRHVWTINDTNGTTVAQLEQITKNGTLYIRETQQGSPSTWLAWQSFPGRHGSDHFPCVADDVAQQSQLGPSGESEEQPPERHITSTITLPTGEGTETRETWVDANNTPLRGKRTISPPSGTAIVANLTFAEFGTANVITAPELAGS